MPGTNEIGLGDLGGIMPPIKPGRKHRGVTIDLEKNPVPTPQSNLDEVNADLAEKFGDLASPPENMYVKDTPEEIAERNARKAAEMEQAMQNYNALKQQSAMEEAAATGGDPLTTMMENIPKAETTPDTTDTVNAVDLSGGEKPAAAPPKQRKIEVVQGPIPGDLNPEQFKTVDVSRALPHIPTPEEADEAAQKLWNDLDKAVERTKQQITDDQEKLFDKMREEQMELHEAQMGEQADATFPSDHSLEDKEEGDISDDAYSGLPKRDPSQRKALNDMTDDDLDDFEAMLDQMSTDEVVEVEESEEERKARIEKTRKEITAQIADKIAPIKNKIDVTGFTISKKPIAALKVLKMMEQQPLHEADWVMPRAKRRFTMSALSGAEIINLNPQNSQLNRFNTIKRMYQILYMHVVDANKPPFEAWLKTIFLEDVPHLYFGAYRATFGESNFLPATCTDGKCQSAFLQDLNDTEDLVVYKDDETKEMVHRLLEGDTTTATEFEAIASEMYQISDDYIITLRRPTIYTTLMETASLPENFLNKYADMIDVISYIDGMYLIDHKNKEFIPIEVKTDPNSASKTAAYKIRTYHDILRKVSSDIYSNLYGYILMNYEDEEIVSYHVPECTCPKCATKIPAQDMTAQQLLFTRHQLAAYGNI